MRVLLDTNILLDSILQRPPWRLEADAILQAAARGSVVCAATSLSLATVFYVARRSVGAAQARVAVRDCIQAFEILSIDRQTLLQADALAGRDFEDDIVIAAASVAGVDAIVTRNASDFSHSVVPVWAPTDLLHRVGASGSSISGQNPSAKP